MVTSERDADGLDELLRVSACPGCGYSLAGLPDEGTCPECGRGYDQLLAVLIGRGRGRFDSVAGGTWRGSVFQALGLVALFWLGSSGRQGFGNPVVLPWLVIGTLVLGAQVYARLFSPNAPHMQLWVGARGIVQLPSTAEARGAHSFAGDVQFLTVPLMVAAMVFVMGPLGRTGMLVLAGAGAAMILILWWRRRWRERTVSDPAQSVPDLWPWHMIELIDVRPLSGDRAWIRCRVTRRWGRVPVSKDWVVDIEVPCRAAVREELHRKLWAWRTDAVSRDFT